MNIDCIRAEAVISLVRKLGKSQRLFEYQLEHEELIGDHYWSSWTSRQGNKIFLEIQDMSDPKSPVLISFGETAISA